MEENCVVAMCGSRQHSVGEGEGVHSHNRYETLGKKERCQEGKIPNRIWKPFLDLQGAFVLSLKCLQEVL